MKTQAPDLGFLSSFPLFADIPAHALSEAANLCSARKKLFRRGETVFFSGCAPCFFGLVESGSVLVYHDDADGSSTLMACVTPGKSFGESLYYLKKDSPVYAVAAEDSAVYLLSLPQITVSSPLSGQLFSNFTRILAERALSMNNRIQVLSKLTLREKITVLIKLSSDPAGKAELSFSRETMALYLGTNRSALSRELSEMKKLGLLEITGRTYRLL